MLNANEAMVVLYTETITDEQRGPKGAYGIPLLAERAIAVDPEFVPLGSWVCMASKRPDTGQPLRQVGFAPDTGAAIKGAGRMARYWGSGERGGAFAGKMERPGA